METEEQLPELTPEEALAFGRKYVVEYYEHGTETSKMKYGEAMKKAAAETGIEVPEDAWRRIMPVVLQITMQQKLPGAPEA